ncbi:Septin-domain-containing protein [Geopyxis carbonaria]|nr:Septin-domain-containing protein [Geopyxis carbonaria]
MRPNSTDALIQGSSPRPRKLSEPRMSTSTEERDRDPSPPMTYFLAGEAQMQASTASVATATPSSPSNFGVRSLEASVSDAELRRAPSAAAKGKAPTVAPLDHDDEEVEDESQSSSGDEGLDDLDRQSVTSLQSSMANHDFLSSTSNHSPMPVLSEPMTPIREPTPSILGTQKSMQHSGGDQMLGLAPQLIMPELSMPSRRPFTEKGKRIPRLKVLIAGDSGIGKTSLIKSIVQTCEDIVHVDPLSTSATTAPSFRHGIAAFTGKRPGDSETTGSITEVHASTRAYPHWWSEIDDSKVLRRRKSTHGVEAQIIERNLCFVDTPGYGSGTSFLECIEPVVQYVEGQFDRTNSIINNGEGDLMSLVSGSGTPQVDIVFYVVLHRLKPVDVEFIRRLSPFTNVLPVIAKADTLAPQQIINLKLSILNELRSAGIRPFLFGKSSADIMRQGTSEEFLSPTAPFAISSVVSSDEENMDASVLMSPEYIPPLIDTELKSLVDNVFDPDNIAWLKHATAKKFMTWRENLNFTSSSLISTRGLNSPSRQQGSPARGSPSASGMLGNSTLIQIGTTVGGGAENFALAKVADHRQREDRLAKVRLVRWSHDLQKSVQAERDRYDRLARGERAIWLTERLNECILDGQLVPMTNLHKFNKDEISQPTVVNTRDPFGFLRINETFGHNLLVMFKVAGLGGLVGVVGVWVYKQWGAGMLEVWK